MFILNIIIFSSSEVWK